MEDILASIKRIIAEDSEAAGVRPPRSRRDPPPVLGEPKPVTDQTVPQETETAEIAAPVVEEAEEESQVPVSADEPQHDLSQEPRDVLELTSPIDIAESEEEPVPEPATATIPNPAQAFEPETLSVDGSHPAPVAGPTPVAQPADTLLSDPARTASRTAFAALTQLQVRAETGQENTLEGLVADLLRPMLSEWLDRELPSLVERLVAAEIARVSGRA